MDFEAFMKHLREQVDEFEEFYRKGMKNATDPYHSEMNIAEWMEQFQSWDELN